MKKMSFISLLVLLVFGILLSGCPVIPANSGTTNNPTNPVNPNKKMPGQFSATLLSDTMGNSSARGVSLGTYTIASSKSIFFILRNVGDFPITGIALTPGNLYKNGEFEPITDNAVNASPSAITVLETSGNTTVEMVIEVNINHGDIIGLVAQQYVQKADFAGTTLRISGMTTDEDGAELELLLDLDIETNIKVASFDFFYSLDNGETFEKMEFNYDYGAFTYPYLVEGKINDYIVIKNTGSVDIEYYYYATKYESSPSVLQPNEYSSLLSFDYDENYYAVLVVNTMGVVFNNQGNRRLRFQTGSSIVEANFMYLGRYF